MMKQLTRRSWRRNGNLVAITLILLLSLTSRIVAAQSEPAPDDSSVSFEITVTDVTDPGELSINPNRLWIRGLIGQANVSGDITGTATTETNINWVGPCDTATLTCRGQQVSRQLLTISDDTGEWKGHLQLTINPVEEDVTIAGVLIGYRDNAGKLIFIEAVTTQSAASLSVTGHQIGRATPVNGIDLRSQVCLDQDLTGSGNYLSNIPPLESGSVEAILTRMFDFENGKLDTAAWTTVMATFTDENGSLDGQSMEESTAADGSVGRFVILGGDGMYAGAQGYGRSGSQLIEDAGCVSGYALRSFWIGELYLNSTNLW